MVSGYYRHGAYYRAMNLYGEILDLVEENGYDFLNGLPEGERELGKALFDYLVNKGREYEHEEFLKTDDLKSFSNQDLIVSLKDGSGKNYICKFVGDDSEVVHVYYNATHDFFDCYKTVRSVEVQKLGKTEFAKSEGLTRLFDGLAFSTSASTCYDLLPDFDVRGMTPELIDLNLVARGLSIIEVKEKVKREYIKRQEEKKRQEEEEEKLAQDEARLKDEDELVKQCEKKTGKVTSYRGKKSKLVNNEEIE